MNEQELLEDLRVCANESRCPSVVTATSRLLDRGVRPGVDTLNEQISHGRVVIVALSVRQELYAMNVAGSRLSLSMTVVRVWVARQYVSLDDTIRSLL